MLLWAAWPICTRYCPLLQPGLFQFQLWLAKSTHYRMRPSAISDTGSGVGRGAVATRTRSLAVDGAWLEEQRDRCRTNHRRANGQVSRQFDFGQARRGQSHRSRYDGASAGTNRTIVRYNILQSLLFGEKLCSPKRPLTREN